MQLGCSAACGAPGAIGGWQGECAGLVAGACGVPGAGVADLGVDDEVAVADGVVVDGLLEEPEEQQAPCP